MFWHADDTSVEYPYYAFTARKGNTMAETHATHTEGNKPKRGTFRSLMSMLTHHKGALTFAIVLNLVSAGLSLAQPAVINMLITAFENRDADAGISAQTVTPIFGLSIGQIATLLVGLLLFSAISSALENYVLARTAEAAVLQTRRNLISRLIHLPIRVFDKHHTGDLVTRLGSDTTLVRAAFTGGLVDAIGGTVTMLGAIILMALIDVYMLLLVLAVVLVALVVVIFASRLVQKHTKAAQKSVGDLGAGMERALVAIRTVRSGGKDAEETTKSLLDENADEAFIHGRSIARVLALLSPATGIALQGAFLAVLGIGGMRVAAGSIGIGDLVSFVLYLFMVASPIGMIFSAVTTVRQAMGALERINQILDEEPEDVSGAPLSPRPGASAVEFANVDFTYPASPDPNDPDAPVVENQPVLHNVSFTLPHGTKTAIVGSSGSGKSTTLALLERFYDVDSGTITVFGNDVSEVSRHSLRDNIGYVEQEPAILAGSVRENLQLAGQTVTDEELWDALEQVNMAERFRREEGLDTVLGERGMTLSGGQRQRLALARMLLMNAPLMLLDEPTSAVDSRNEQLILDAVEATAQGRTTIIVAHRLSTVTDADQIIVLEDGRVQGIGTHAELMEKNDIYRELATRQLLT